jgi:hypothetical protein
VKDVNQIANLALVEWPDNTAISGAPLRRRVATYEMKPSFAETSDAVAPPRPHEDEARELVRAALSRKRCARADSSSGSDGTRTRDLRRDRPVMALPG